MSGTEAELAVRRAKQAQYRPLAPFAERAAEIRQQHALSPGMARRVALFDKACAAIDVAAYTALQARYAARMVDFDPIGPLKYLDAPFWLWDKTRLAVDLNIDRAPPRRVLDIGAGCGHFPFLCQAAGAEMLGIDIELALYRDVTAMLGLDILLHRIERGAELPDLGAPFDLVTMIWVTFDYAVIGADGRRAYWTVADWAGFINRIARRCADGARLYLELNPYIQPGGETGFNVAFLDACARNGGTVQHNRVSNPRITLPLGPRFTFQA